MSDYNFSEMSSRHFEQLVQSIAVSVLGPGTTIFGDGPDGGREAIFEGRVPYPSSANQWNGYIVIQAKFRQRSKSQSDDNDWVLAQLESELKKYSENAGGRKKPDYYIFATNVVLTPAQGSGSKDKAEVLLNQCKSDVPLKGFALWDYDQIGTFIDNNESLRRRYTAFLSSGDVLAKMMEWLEVQQPDFASIMSNFLQKELYSDQYVNLGQAGHSSVDKIPVAKVFVDVPTSDVRFIDPPNELQQDPEDFVNNLLRISAERLDTVSTEAGHLYQPSRGVAGALRVSEAAGRIVLIGGPGQGKSTVTQFIAQLFRAAILLECPLLTPETRQALSTICEQSDDEGIKLPSTRRFPVRIILSEFAQALASGKVSSVVSYISEKIKKRTDREVTPADLRQWLSNYPWIVFFDGLDEVPSSSNRSEVLDKIQEFLIDTAECEADVLVVATTRPQGYNNEFSPEFYSHKFLAPLSIGRALHYGRKLIRTNHPSDEDRQEQLIHRLEQAAEGAATARLMRSPLQVTIMAALAERVGTPPQERWSLFSGYYEVIYNRELEKDISAAKILRAYKPDIDAIHNRVGLVLQVECDKSGSTEAKLPVERFESLVEARLREEGNDGDKLATLKKAIKEAATDRLVFLVGLQNDEIGFEVRSLQEFMAAEELMTGADTEVRERLQEVAPIASWRNVFLFATGKCFAKVSQQHFRDNIVTICFGLNQNEDKLTRAVLAGSQLALDILEDGSCKLQPKYAKMFADLGLHLLNLPPQRGYSNTAALYDTEFAELYQKKIGDLLTQNSLQRQLPAWGCLLQLVNSDCEWAEDLAQKSWPADISSQVEILDTVNFIPSNAWLLSVVIGATSCSTFDNIGLPITNYFERDASIIQNDTRLPEWFKAAVSLKSSTYLSNHSLLFRLHIDEAEFAVRISTPLNSMAKFAALLEMPSPEPTWTEYINSIRFALSPSKASLGQALRACSENFDPAFPRDADLIPWPLFSCLQAATVPSDLVSMAELAEVGSMGGREEWEAAEQRWKEVGVLKRDLLYAPASGLPFDDKIASIGFPMNASLIYSNEATSSKLYQIYSDLAISPLRDQFAACLLRTLILIASSAGKGDNIALKLTSEELTTLLDEAQETEDGYFDVLLINVLKYDDVEEIVNFLDYVGTTKTLYKSHQSYEFAPSGINFFILFLTHPDKIGLIQWLYILSQQSANPKLPYEAIAPEKFTLPTIKQFAISINAIQGTLPNDKISAGMPWATSEVDFFDSALFHLATLEGPEDADTNSIQDFLMAALASAPLSEWSNMRYVLLKLNNYLKSRISRLGQKEVWDKLKLPSC